MTIRIVDAPLLGVVKDFVGFGRFLEMLFRFLVPWISIGMILEGQLPVCFLYFVFIRLA